jgi:uncharacterized protein YlxP (DUF503 family)
VLEIELDLRHSRSLKDKRKLLSSLKAQLRRRFVAAVAEAGDHDDRRRATLVVALVGGSEVGARADQVQRLVEERCPDGCRVHRDLLSLADIRS